MRKTVIILSVLALMAGSCGQTTKKQDKADKTESAGNTEQMYANHLIREDGVDIFWVGKQIPFNAENYIIKKEIIQFEEGIEEPI